MATVQTLTEPLVQGDYERLKFRADPTGPPFDITTGRVLFTARLKNFSGPIILQKASTTPGQIVPNAETDANGNVWHHIIINEADLVVPEIARDTTLACDVVLEDSSGRDSSTKFYVPVETRATPPGT